MTATTKARTGSTTSLVVREVDLPPEATLDAPELVDLGFRPLATFAIGHEGVEPVPTRVYAARYGDAYAFADPMDADVRLRVVSALASGRLVETRVPARTSRVRTMLDDLVARADRVKLAARYPDRPGLGLRRQLVDVGDLATLWVSHRGLVRRVEAEGAGDAVLDHGSTTLLTAVLERAWSVRGTVDLPEVRLRRAIVTQGRNVLLALPALIALWVGLAWWAAGLSTGVPALVALLVADAVRTPPWRPWLILVPLAMAIFGRLTMGMGLGVGMLAWDVAVVAFAELAAPRFVLLAFVAANGEPTSPPPVPFAPR